jgi:hypothetical protein
MVRVDNELWTGSCTRARSTQAASTGTFFDGRSRFDEGVIKLEANLANPAARHYKK